MKQSDLVTYFEPVENESKTLEDGTVLKVVLFTYEIGKANKKYKVVVFQNATILDESNFFITYLKAKQIFKKLTEFYIGVKNENSNMVK